MVVTLSPETVGPGQPAPDFSLPLVSAEGRVTMADYRGRAPLFLVLLRSFECPFCRRTLAALKSVGEAMAEYGIETLVITTTPEREARLYTRYRPPGLPLASDPTLGTHRAFGVPIYRFTTDGPTRWPWVFNPADLSKLVVTGSSEA
jgi:peroxiredoxin